MADFTSLTTPSPLGDGRWAAVVPDGWQQGRGAFGGLVLAMMVRAVESELAGGGARPLRSLQAELCAPVVPGPVEIAVERLREGSAVSTVAARLVQSGALCAHGVAVLAEARAADFSVDLGPAPSPPAAWRETPVVALGPPLAPVFVPHFEVRPTSPPPFSGAGEARASGWVRAHAPGPARDAAYLAALVDVYWPAAFPRLAAPRPIATLTFGLQIVGSFEGLDADAPVYHEGRCIAARDGYLAEARQLRGEDGRLLALNQQTFAVIK